MKKRIPYGIGDFESLILENYYYVDKTRIIEDLEMHRYPFFIRPRRFGKSLLISMLEDYYDIEKKDWFDDCLRGYTFMRILHRREMLILFSGWILPELKPAWGREGFLSLLQKK